MLWGSSPVNVALQQCRAFAQVADLGQMARAELLRSSKDRCSR